MTPDPAVVDFGWVLPGAAVVFLGLSKAKSMRAAERDARSVERHQRKMRAIERVIETPGLELR